MGAARVEEELEDEEEDEDMYAIPAGIMAASTSSSRPLALVAPAMKSIATQLDWESTAWRAADLCGPREEGGTNGCMWALGWLLKKF